MAEIYNKGGTKKTVIFALREFLPQKIRAPGWVDLRVGFFLSLTQETADDTITALDEEIGTPPRPLLGTADRYQIGLIDSLTGTVFCGFTNRSPAGRERTAGTTKLVSSDGGIGTSNANFWRPKNEINDAWQLQIIDNSSTRAQSGTGSEIHFAQDATGAGGYATLLMLRFQRDNATSRAKVITMSCKRDTVNRRGEIMFSDTPTETVMDTQLQAALPATMQTLGPAELSQEPDALFFYWPFRQSRLRLHCAGIYKAE